MSSVIRLVNLIGWEVSSIDVGSQLRFEWGSNTSKSIKLDAAEELVGFDLAGTPTTESIFRVADEASNRLDCDQNRERNIYTFE